MTLKELMSPDSISTTIRFKDRDIIKVYKGDKVQPFYRSTGRNSGKEGTWFPFDGLEIFPLWFDKRKFVWKPGKNDVPEHLHRYGTDEFKAISDRLGEMNLPEGIEMELEEVVRWLKDEY